MELWFKVYSVIAIKKDMGTLDVKFFFFYLDHLFLQPLVWNEILLPLVVNTLLCKTSIPILTKYLKEKYFSWIFSFN